VYYPRTQPGPASSLRALAYRENTETLPGPISDPEGWHMTDTVIIRGRLFKERQVEVRIRVSFTGVSPLHKESLYKYRWHSRNLYAIIRMHWILNVHRRASSTVVLLSRNGITRFIAYTIRGRTGFVHGSTNASTPCSAVAASDVQSAGHGQSRRSREKS
jgi:hypothetical protein